MDFRKSYKIKHIELDALLDLTNAINTNQDEDSLLRIFLFIMLANYKIHKITLFMKEEENWKCILSHGCETDFYNISNIDTALLESKEVIYIDEKHASHLKKDFDILIPVINSGQNIAMLGIKGIGIEDKYIQEHVRFIQTMANILMVAVLNLKLNRKRLEQEAINQQMEIARQMQSYLFPKTLPREDHLKIYSKYLPHYSVGGDYYDYIPLNENEFVICIADVSGKGIPASILMSNFQASLRILIRQNLPLKQVTTELNKLVNESAQGEKFITMFLAKYNLENYTIEYVNAGHNNLPLFNHDMEYRELSEGTTILGTFHELPLLDIGYIEDCKNTLLFAYTDGLVENFNANDEEFELDKIIPLIKQNDDRALLHEEILNELYAFKGDKQLSDDITMLTCCV